MSSRQPPPQLQWQQQGVVLVAFVTTLRARRRGQLPAQERQVFALIRPATQMSADGIVELRPGNKWVVNRANTFDDLNTFDTKEEAVIYVQSLYALQTT